MVVLPGGGRSRIASVETFDGPLDEATARMSVTVGLVDDIDVGRGDMLAPASDPPEVRREFEATLCWFSARPVHAGDRFRVKHTTRVTPAEVVAVDARLDIATLGARAL